MSIQRRLRTLRRSPAGVSIARRICGWTFQAGTLVIDIIDSKSYKLLKRGYATRPILKNLPDDAKAARIQDVVDEILRDLRVAH